MDLYTDWLLNGSIAKSFDAFKRGFDLVLGQSCLADLFMAEELELLICGSNVSDVSFCRYTETRLKNEKEANDVACSVQSDIFKVN